MTPTQGEHAQTALAHELFAAAQLAPGEGIEDAVSRIAAALTAAPFVSDGLRTLHEAILNRLSHAELLEKAHYLMELNSNQARTIGELQDLVEVATAQPAAPQGVAYAEPTPDELRAIAREARNSSGSASDDCGAAVYVLYGWRAAMSKAPSIDDLCARIKAADDAAADSDYMLDSNDCIAVLRGQWKGPMAMDKPERASNGQAPAGAVPDEQMIAEYGIKASRMMARDLTRFDAACEVDKYLREQGAPGYYRHRMSIILFGNVEGTEASRAPENSEPSPTAQAAPASVLHLVHSAFAEIAMAFPKAFALHKVGIADTAVREALEAPAAGAVAWPTRAEVANVFLANGFTVKEGQSDLKPYVYDAAYALPALAAAPTPAAQADSQPAPLSKQQICDKFDFLEGMVNEWGFDRIVEAAAEIQANAIAASAQADSVLEDAARLDWLALAGPTSICVVLDRENDGEVEVSTDDVTGYGKTLREAIDAARKQGGKHD